MKEQTQTSEPQKPLKWFTLLAVMMNILPIILNALNNKTGIIVSVHLRFDPKTKRLRASMTTEGSESVKILRTATKKVSSRRLAGYLSTD
jgi:hypothetical protein